jgi:hypothetical protein
MADLGLQVNHGRQPSRAGREIFAPFWFDVEE